MDDGLLENIIQTEKQLQAELAAEEQRVRNWQEQELARLDAELEAARAHSQRGDREAIKQARVAAREESDALLRSIQDWCRRLQALDDRELGELLGRRLGAILPEDVDDHPHGQS